MAIVHTLRDTHHCRAEDLKLILQQELGKDARCTTCGDRLLDYNQAIDFELIRE